MQESYFCKGESVLLRRVSNCKGEGVCSCKRKRPQRLSSYKTKVIATTAHKGMAYNLELEVTDEQ